MSFLSWTVGRRAWFPEHIFKQLHVPAWLKCWRRERELNCATFVLPKASEKHISYHWLKLTSLSLSSIRPTVPSTWSPAISSTTRPTILPAVWSTNRSTTHFSLLAKFHPTIRSMFPSTIFRSVPQVLRRGTLQAHQRWSPQQHLCCLICSLDRVPVLLLYLIKHSRSTSKKRYRSLNCWGYSTNRC